MADRAETALQGMKEICSYVNRSEVTILLWIRGLGFPASKIAGGIWESDKKLVDQWRRDMLSLGVVSQDAPKGKRQAKQIQRERRW